MKSKKNSICGPGSNALVIPSSIDKSCSTAAERKVHSLLSQLPSNCTVRYEMSAYERKRKPTFSVISPDHGLCILDVKDWTLKSLFPTQEGNFRLIDSSGKSIFCVNPQRKNLLFIKKVCENLKCKSLPANYTLVLPYLSRNMFCILGMKGSLDMNRVLFREDLQRSKTFIEKFMLMFPRLENPLDNDLIIDMEKAAFPDLKMFINTDQEEAAKSILSGTRLLQGTPNSGKTLILTYAARVAALDNPGYKILHICNNPDHVSDIQKYHDMLKLPECENVEIYSFKEFIETMISRYNIKFGRTHKTKTMQVFDALHRSNVKYDAVFLDEAQDFEKLHIEQIYEKLVKGERALKNFVIADDYIHRQYKIPFFAKPRLIKTRERQKKELIENQAPLPDNMIWIS